MTNGPTPHRRLHIGGSEQKPGWEILDALPAPHVDHLGDARRLSAFQESTFAEVYASHVLEHFDYKEEILAVLREWHRVLQPGGTLYVSVPDLHTLCRLYLDPRLGPVDRFQVMRMIFGGHMDQYDYHLAGIEQAFLESCLARAGFVDLRRVQSFGIFADSSEGQLFDVPISLNMTARKG